MLENKHFFYNYDLDATTFKYGRIGDAQGYPIQGHGGVDTSGSSTTVSAATDTVPAAPFSPVDVGDIIVFCQPPDTQYLRKVATKTSGTEITVDTAVNLAATGGWYFYPFNVGATAATNIWHQVSEYRTLYVNILVTTLAAAGGVDYSIEGATGGNLSGIVPLALQNGTGTITATGTFTIKVEEPVLLLRVGLKGHTGFAGTDSISVWLTGDLRSGRK